MKLLEVLTPEELKVFNDNLLEVVGLSAPFFTGYTVEQVLQYLAETPGEYCLDEWEPLLRNLGYDHVANRYMPDELLPVIVADMATAPGLPIFLVGPVAQPDLVLRLPAELRSDFGTGVLDRCHPCLRVSVHTWWRLGHARRGLVLRSCPRFRPGASSCPNSSTCTP